MKKVILVLIMSLTLFGCSKNVNNNEESLKREKYINNENIKRENLYGCWKYDSLDVYADEKLIYDGATKGTIKFNENDIEYCYYYETGKSKCEKFNYKIENNKLIIEESSILNEFYNISLYEGSSLNLSLSTVIDTYDYLYHLSYSKDCKFE